MTTELDKEILHYLSKKTIYFNKFSDRLKTYLKNTFPNLSSIKAQWFMIKNNLIIIPICAYPTCENSVKWNDRNNNFDNGCCTNHNKKITSLKNFGTDHPNQNKNQLATIKKSMQDKYGVDNIAHLESTQLKRKQTNTIRYGVEEVGASKIVRYKIKHTNLKRYGVTEVLSSPEIRTKVKNTVVERYGVDEVLSSPEIRDKINKTNLSKYGTIFPMRDISIQEKRRTTVIEKYDAHGVNSNPIIIGKLKETQYKKYYTNILMKNKFIRPKFDLKDYNSIDNYKWECLLCNNEFVDNNYFGNISVCRICFPNSFEYCNGESDLFDSINIGNKNCNSQGIYLQNFKLLIVFNSLVLISAQNGKDKYYNLDRTIVSENNGIDLIHIYENDWVKSKKYIIDIIDKVIGNTTEIDLMYISIKNINNKEKKEFLKTNSMYGDDLFTKENRGIFLEDELVAIMSIAKSKKGFEVRQYVIKLGISFKNGNPFDLLFKSFGITANTIYYIDRRFKYIYDVDVLGTGFTFEGTTEPLMYYTNKNNIVIPSSIITICNILNYIDIYDPILTIRENMIVNGYLTIWDCGRLVYKFY